ncbi:LysE family translocator [Marinomonas sp. THO17]|uniref:LysE family translocator n=1 Tax=Marinomonas sp. THO17 TaxID=3149048 RepID=UPI00336BE1D4
MDNYLLYVGVVMATVSLPGPAVLLTLNNAVQKGLIKTFAGISGIALAILLVATLSATSLGIILAGSAVAFNLIKIAGAVYLIYLGVKLWRSKVSFIEQTSTKESSLFRCFMEGFLVSITNPKAIVFFMSIFPQFIDVHQAYIPQFVLLAVTFSCVVVAIHTLYTLFALRTKRKINENHKASQGISRVLNKMSGGIFIGFGVGLAASSR